MNRNLSKRPKEVRDWKSRRLDIRHLLDNENAALFAVLVAFVKWMQAPISPWAGSPFVEFVDETGTRHR